MNISITSVIGGIAGIAMAVSGWFAANESSLATRVDSLATQQAATSQYASDTDARLTRIENKLDILTSQGSKISALR